jgi:hypothetical protein
LRSPLAQLCEGFVLAAAMKQQMNTLVLKRRFLFGVKLTTHHQAFNFRERSGRPGLVQRDNLLKCFCERFSHRGNTCAFAPRLSM